MRLRIASINDLPINESERKYHWPLGRRPDDHPSLSGLGLWEATLDTAAARPRTHKSACLIRQVPGLLFP